MAKKDVMSQADQKSNTLAHGRQDDINDRLFTATNRHLHGDAVSQRQAGTNQRVMTTPKHTWEERTGEPIVSHLSEL